MIESRWFPALPVSSRVLANQEVAGFGATSELGVTHQMLHLMDRNWLSFPARIEYVFALFDLRFSYLIEQHMLLVNSQHRSSNEKEDVSD